jgi:hypothetical protein
LKLLQHVLRPGTNPSEAASEASLLNGSYWESLCGSVVPLITGSADGGCFSPWVSCAGRQVLLWCHYSDTDKPRCRGLGAIHRSGSYEVESNKSFLATNPNPDKPEQENKNYHASSQGASRKTRKTECFLFRAFNLSWFRDYLSKIFCHKKHESQN